MKPIIAKFSTILLTLAAFCSCSIRDHFPDGGLQPSEAQSTFVVSAGARVQHSSRAITQGGDDDNAVEEITVLFFYDDEDNGYPYHSFIRPTALESVTTNTWKFSAPLPKGNYKALFLANAKEQIDQKYDLVAGTVEGGGEMTDLTMNDVTEALSYSVGGKYNANTDDEDYRPFFMSSDRETFTVPFDPGKYLEDPIRLARDVAKINVRFVAPDAQFEISSIELYNYYTKSYIVAAPGWWEHNNAGEAGKTAALLADDAARPIEVGSVVTGGLTYDGEEIAVSECVDEIFTPEQLADGADNPYLIVKGNVTIDGVTHSNRWYKLEFARKDANGEFRHVNLLRNYVYTILITEIEDEGYGSREEAVANRPNNLVFELDAREEGLGSFIPRGLGSFVYNGQYYLGVTKNIYQFIWSPYPQNFIVHTNYPTGWTMIDLPTGGWPTWAGNSPVQYGNGNETLNGQIWPKARTTPEPHELTFTIEAGPLRQEIFVKQEDGSPVLDIASHQLDNPLPAEGGTYEIRVRTNLQDWRLHIWGMQDNLYQKIIDQLGTNETVDPGSTQSEYSTYVTIPENNTNVERDLGFYLYNASPFMNVNILSIRQAPM